MTRPTDTEIAAMLSVASWQVQGVGYQMTADKREEMAREMRRMALAIFPPNVSDMTGAEEYYRPGVYNGD
jgi:hypothetical protein